jgi:hypothetical protein
MKRLVVNLADCDHVLGFMCWLFELGAITGTTRSRNQ